MAITGFPHLVDIKTSTISMDNSYKMNVYSTILGITISHKIHTVQENSEEWNSLCTLALKFLWRSTTELWNINWTSQSNLLFKTTVSIITVHDTIEVSHVNTTIGRNPNIDHQCKRPSMGPCHKNLCSILSLVYHTKTLYVSYSRWGLNLYERGIWFCLPI